MSDDTVMTICGVGAVTAAGWSCREYVDAVSNSTILTSDVCGRLKGVDPRECRVLRVPAPPPGRLPKSPRLRRASPINSFAIGAALEALAQAGCTDLAPPLPDLGLVFCTMNGSISFTDRFYSEVLRDPALASPILFPETVFNAPASHIAYYLGITGRVSTLIGDSTVIVEAIHMASGWIRTGEVARCLVIAAEEADWLSTEAVAYYHPGLIASEGAAAFVLSADGEGPRLQRTEGPFHYRSREERGTRIDGMIGRLADHIPAGDEARAILIDDQTGLHRLDKQESAALRNRWRGESHSPKKIIGETMGAAGALQLALAAALVREQRRPAVVSMPGSAAAAYGCVLVPQENL